MTEYLGLFKEFELKDRNRLKEIFYNAGRNLSVHNFANLFMWRRFHKYKWTEYENQVLIYAEKDDFAVLAPGNDLTPDDYLKLSELLQNNKRKAEFAFVPVDFAEKYPEMSDQFIIEKDEDNADYIYTSEKLADLPGRNLHKKKNLLKQFQRGYPDYKCVELTPEYFQDCIDHTEKWCEATECAIVPYAYERDAITRGFEHFDELEMGGLVIIVDDEVAAFSVYNRLSHNAALIHFEKFDREVKGSGQAINWETARRLRDDYEYLNREQDLGIPGLRRAKQSYLPDRWAVTLTLKRK